jgi:2-polyprenyl-6-methoxyphenol hydroxylase-like FAD-dependent oxidoreductase
MREITMTSDVVIVGGGPNGLMLALELRLAGIQPIVLERLPVRDGPVRANGLVGRVVQLLDYRGLFERLSDGVPEPRPMPVYLFGGFILDLRRLADNPLHGLPVPQPRLEAALEARAGELGIDLRRGHELRHFSQDADGVEVEVRGPDGDYTLRSRYLVGCDGAASTVRKVADIGFPDMGDQDIVSRGADVILPAAVTGESSAARADGVLPLSGSLDVPGLGRLPFGFTRTARGVFGVTSLEPGIHTVATNEWGRSSVDATAPMTVAEMRDSTRRVLGVDLPMRAPTTTGARRLHRLVGNSRQADCYRSGRVLLVGDAAHVHAPIGGPGLNLGMQDAVNLGWKLAACLHGWAPPGLLDTYHAERHPVGRRVLMQTQAQLALMAPGTEVSSLRSIFEELLADERNLSHIAGLMAGTDIRYQMRAVDGTPPPLLGRWAPDLPLVAAGGRVRLAELMRAGRPVLLDLTGESQLAEACVAWKDRVDVVPARLAEPVPAPSAMLIRPDGYVAWVPEPAEVDAAAIRGLPEALATWFGAAG